MASNKQKPGTERHRDEARDQGGARIHGRLWHDDELRDLQRDFEIASDAVPDVEAAPERIGMGRGKARPYRQTSGRRELSRSPRGKGVSHKHKSRT